MIKYCRTCRILDPRQNVCQLSRQPVDPNKDYCTKHQEDIYQCERCHQATLMPFFTRHGDLWHVYCGDCIQLLNTCAFCKGIEKCDFETNPSSLPKLVQKQVRQGNMVSITTVKNPERIRQTCENGCNCFSAENGCMRDFNYCERMEYIYDDQRNDASESSEVHS